MCASANAHDIGHYSHHFIGRDLNYPSKQAAKTVSSHSNKTQTWKANIKDARKVA